MPKKIIDPKTAGLRYKLLKTSTVMEMTSLSRPTLLRMVEEGNFPQPVRISPMRVAWRSDHVQNWLDELRIDE